MQISENKSQNAPAILHANKQISKLFSDRNRRTQKFPQQFLKIPSRILSTFTRQTKILKTEIVKFATDIKSKTKLWAKRKAKHFGTGSEQISRKSKEKSGLEFCLEAAETRTRVSEFPRVSLRESKWACSSKTSRSWFPCGATRGCWEFCMRRSRQWWSSRK